EPNAAATEGGRVVDNCAIEQDQAFLVSVLSAGYSGTHGGAAIPDGYAADAGDRTGESEDLRQTIAIEDCITAPCTGECHVATLYLSRMQWKRATGLVEIAGWRERDPVNARWDIDARTTGEGDILATGFLECRPKRAYMIAGCCLAHAVARIRVIGV